MSSPYLKIGTKLHGNKYTIVSVLGQGGFGITYKAIMKEKISGNIGALEIEIPVAIKEFFMQESCLRDENTSRVSVPSTGSKTTVEQFRHKFVKEANNLAALSHPNIVKVIDVFSENETDYYVMEYLEGGSLRDLVKNKGKFDEATALEYIYKVGDALSYMHTQKHMCHYDVKPGNIMLDKQNSPKLIDFGISKNYDSEGNQTSSTPVGISKGFAPLEQYQQSVRELSPQTDIYALGATLYYLLTGNVPPEASLVFNEGLPALPDTISPSTRDAINQAMEPRKKDRPKTIKAFISLLKGEDDSSQVENDYTYVHAGENYYDVNEEEVDNNTSDETLVEYIPPTQIQQEDKITQNINIPKNEERVHSSERASFLVFAGLISVILLSLIINSIIENTPADAESINRLNSEETTPKVKQVNSLNFKSAIGEFLYSGPVDEESKPNGKGYATFLDGRRYVGNFVHGVLDGEASFYYGNGDNFQGTFSNNKFKQGRYTIREDNSYFVGTFKDGRPYQGNWYDKNGKVLY